MFRTRTAYLLLLFVLTAILAGRPQPAWGQAPAADENPPAAQPKDEGLPTDQIIIRYKEGAQGLQDAPGGDAQRQRLSQAAGTEIRYLREMSDKAHVLRLPGRLPEAAVQQIAERLMALPEVEYAGPDSIRTHALVPNDPSYTSQWNFFSPDITYGGKRYFGINAPAGWDVTTGAPGVVVAVLDTGILKHADLAGRTVPGYDFIHDSLVANDGDGRDNNPADPGDWITPAESSAGYFRGCPVYNSTWHGTHVAGIIGAKSNNGLGVAGINWNSKILPVRVLGKCGGYDSDIIEALYWSAGVTGLGVPANPNPAKVINLSLGGPGACPVSWQSAVNSVTKAGATVVVAAGNSNNDAAYYTPASCSGVITVAATNRYGLRAFYSNYGFRTVKISAPGGDTRSSRSDGILSTLNTGVQGPLEDGYAYYQGTSMAAAHVSGVLSLLYSAIPSLTPAQRDSILSSSATAFPPLGNCYSSCGDGIVNAGKALAALAPPQAFTKLTPENHAVNQPTTIDLSWDASKDAVKYEVCVDTSNDNICDHDYAWSDLGLRRLMQFSALANKTYYWMVRAQNPLGVTYSNNNTWWEFTTIPYPPWSFNKTAPIDGAMGQPLTLDLSWGASSGALKYEYCLDSAQNKTCDSAWISTGMARTASVSGLAQGTVYYWQVRASNMGGVTYANWMGEWFHFTTQGPKPAAFGKGVPAIGSTDLPTSLTLTWAPSSGAAEYHYCLDTTDNGACDTQWRSAAFDTYANISGLAYGTTYYWQVRARNPVGDSNADAGDWWRFDTQPALPGAFDKAYPGYMTRGVPGSLTLSWGSSSLATWYEYCYDTNDNGLCDTAWVTTGLEPYVILTGLSPATTYYWHVRAVTAGEPVYSNNDLWWSFTILHPAFMPYMDR